MIVVTPPGKSSVVSLFYAIKVSTIKSAFVALGSPTESPTESERRFRLLLGILEISSPQPIQCIAESSEGSKIGSFYYLNCLQCNMKVNVANRKQKRISGISSSLPDHI